MSKSRVKWGLFILVIALVCFVGAMPAVSSAQQPVKLRFASFKIGSGWYVMAGVMADIIKRNLPPGSTVDALPKSGGIGNPMLLGLKKAEMDSLFP